MKDTRIAISLRAALYSLFDAGWTFERCRQWAETVHQPTPGYVYSDDVPSTSTL